MSADLVGVLYSTKSMMVRAIIIPQEGDGLGDANILSQQKNPPPDCAIATIAKAGLSNFLLDTLIAAISATQGLVLFPPDVCALVDKKGVVQDIVMADPAHTPIHNGHAVIPNKVGAGRGDKFEGSKFKRDYAIVNKTTGIVVSTEKVTLPDQPKTNNRQRAHVNNDQSLEVGSIIGVVEPK